MTITLPNGARAILEPTLLDEDLVTWGDSTRVRIIAGGHALTLQMARQTQLATTALAAGERLGGADAPMVLLLILAVIGIQNRLPERWQVSLLRTVAMMLPDLPQDSGPARTLRALRAVVRAALRHPTSASPIDLHGNRWDTARLLCLAGEELWALRGDDAARWGMRPMDVPPTDPHWLMRALIAMAGVMAATGMEHGKVSLPLDREGSPVYAIIDWLALAVGPGLPPANLLDGGLGRMSDTILALGTVDERLALDAEQAAHLRELATILLAQTPNPTPRRLGDVLEVDIPPTLMPHLAAWGIVRVRIVPHPEGLWVAVGQDRVEVAAWWAARPESGYRYPISFPPAAWMLVHPVLAALWHDLCADAVIVEQASVPAMGSKASRAPRTGQRRPIVDLPPRRYVGHWASSDDRALITRYVLAGHGYRRLPAGWREREQRPDVQQRRAAAAARARAHGLDAPPPGYTYVSPHQRAVAVASDSAEAATGEQTPARVRARGLFTLMLGLRRAEDANDPTAENEHPSPDQEPSIPRDQAIRPR